MRPLAEGSASNGDFFCEDFLHALFRNNPEDVFYLWTTGKIELSETLRFDDYKNVRRIHTSISSHRLHFLSRFLKYPYLDDLAETMAMKNGHLPWIGKFDVAFLSAPSPVLLEDNCFQVFFSTHFKALHFPSLFSRNDRKYQKKKWYARIFASTDLIFSPSKFHTQEIEEWFGSSVSEKVFQLNTGFTQEETLYVLPQEEKFQDHISESETLESLSQGFEGQDLWDVLPEKYILASGDQETIDSIIQGCELYWARFPQKKIPLILLESFSGEYESYRKQDKIASFFPEGNVDVSVIFSKAEVYIDASLYDTTGSNILYALRCNTPVIVSDYGVFPEILSENNQGIDPLSGVSIYKALKGSGNFVDQSSLFQLAHDSKFSWDDISLKIMHEIRLQLEKREIED